MSARGYRCIGGPHDGSYLAQPPGQTRFIVPVLQGGCGPGVIRNVEYRLQDHNGTGPAWVCQVNPNPPKMTIVWHDTPEAVHRAMWEPVAIDAGMTYEQLLAESEPSGTDEHGNEVTFTHEQEIAGMHEQGCWAFVETHRKVIHAWADPAAPRGRVLHMLAHEIGHATGEPNPDSLQEEMRAEQFGRVAALAFEMLEARA